MVLGVLPFGSFESILQTLRGAFRFRASPQHAFFSMCRVLSVSLIRATLAFITVYNSAASGDFPSANANQSYIF